MIHTSSRLVRSRQLKRGTVALGCVLLGLVAGRIGYERALYPEHPSGARCSQSEIAERALKIGFALNGSARLVNPPMFRAERFPASTARVAQRKLWIALCECGDRQLNLLFDDETGRLSCLVMDSVAPMEQTISPPAVVKTESDAVRIAVQRLRALQILPQGALIALQDKPCNEQKQQAWSVNWLVRKSPQSQPYTIKMTLNSGSSLPTWMVSLEEKG